MTERLGLQYGHVELAESDPAWPEDAQRLAESIRSALGPDALAVEHIGSTAVPGLLSKPILDLAVLVRRDADTTERLTMLGYEFRGDAGAEGGLVFVLSDRPLHRIAHVHVVSDGDPQWSRYLAVRDRLRADPTARAAYAELKLELAARFPRDRPAYTAGKDGFIASL